MQYLKIGQARGSIAGGPMRDVVENSTSKMPEADLRAIAIYLKERGAEGPRTQTDACHPQPVAQLEAAPVRIDRRSTIMLPPAGFWTWAAKV